MIHSHGQGCPADEGEPYNGARWWSRHNFPTRQGPDGAADNARILCSEVHTAMSQQDSGKLLGVCNVVRSTLRVLDRPLPFEYSLAWYSTLSCDPFYSNPFLLGSHPAPWSGLMYNREPDTDKPSTWTWEAPETCRSHLTDFALAAATDGMVGHYYVVDALACGWTQQWQPQDRELGPVWGSSGRGMQCLVAALLFFYRINQANGHMPSGRFNWHGNPREYGMWEVIEKWVLQAKAGRLPQGVVCGRNPVKVNDIYREWAVRAIQRAWRNQYKPGGLVVKRMARKWEKLAQGHTAVGET